MTHTLTHTAKCSKRIRKHRTDFFNVRPMLSAFRFLYGLGKEAAHLLRRLVLFLPRGMGVGA